jgi:hypothetical protein
MTPLVTRFMSYVHDALVVLLLAVGFDVSFDRERRVCYALLHCLFGNRGVQYGAMSLMRGFHKRRRESHSDVLRSAKRT